MKKTQCFLKVFLVGCAVGIVGMVLTAQPFYQGLLASVDTLLMKSFLQTGIISGAVAVVCLLYMRHLKGKK